MYQFVTRIFFLSLVVCSVLMVSCKKDSERFVPDNDQALDSAWSATVPSSAQVHQLAAQLVGKVFVRTLNPTLDSVLETDNGLRIQLPGKFLYLPGMATTLTEVKSEYVMIRKPGDYVRYGIPSQAGMYPLETGGVIFLNLTSNNQPVSIAGEKSILYQFYETDTKPGMNVFYGSRNGFSNTSVFNWVPANDYPQLGVWDSVNPVRKGYRLSTRHGGLIQVGKYIETNSERTKVSVVLPNLFSNCNTSVYLAFKNIRSIVRLEGNASLRTFGVSNIPINEEVLLFSISKIGDSYYLGKLDQRTTAGMLAVVKPVLVELNTIQSFLDGL
jgi:hypothetical protein